MRRDLAVKIAVIARPLLRYLAVGAVATCVHYAMLAALVERASWRAPLAAAGGAWLGAQVAFVGNARFTFGAQPLRWRSWARFQLVAVGGAAISFSFVDLGLRLGASYWLAQVIATVVTVLLTFWLNARWTFTTPPRR